MAPVVWAIAAARRSVAQLIVAEDGGGVGRNIVIRLVR